MSIRFEDPLNYSDLNRDKTNPEQKKTNPEQKETNPEQKIKDAIFGKFEETFKIKLEELESIEGFKDLSLGQQALVLENLKQLTLGRIENEAIDRYNAEIKAKVSNRIQTAANTKFFGKIWSHVKATITNIWRDKSKELKIAKEKKKTAEEILQGGIEIHRETLTYLTKSMKESGPEATVKETGEIEILYAGKFENLTDDEKILVSQFNNVARQFAMIPKEWSSKSAEKRHQKKYKKIKAEYEEALKKIMPLKEKSLGNKRDAALAIADIERKVYFDQLLSQSPDVEKCLTEIKSNKFWKRALRLGKVIGEYVGYLGFGFVARTALSSVIGLFAAPVVSGTISSFIARRRAFEQLRQEEKLSRRGAKEEEAEIAQLKALIKSTKAEYQKAQNNEKVQFLLHKISELEAMLSEKLSRDAKKEEAEIAQLKARIKSTKAEYQKAQKNKKAQQFLLHKISELEAMLRKKQRDAKEEEAEIAQLKALIKSTKAEYQKAQNNEKVQFLLHKISELEAMLSEKQRGEKPFVDALSLNQKIEQLLTKLNNETDVMKRAKIRESLQARINYTYYKLNKGLVNFGKTQEQLATKYNLLKALARAEVEINVPEEILEKINAGDGLTLAKRLEHFLARREAVVSAAEKKYVYQQMKKAIKTSASFSILGYAIGTVVWGPPSIPSGSSLNTFWEKLGLKGIFDGDNIPPEGDGSTTGIERSKPTQNEQIISDEILKRATVGEGEGIEHVLKRQLLAEPEKWGYEGDINNKAALNNWANRKAHLIAIDQGYVNPKTGVETRVIDMGRDGPEGNPAYVLSKDASGKPIVIESFEGKPTGGEKVINIYEHEKEWPSSKMPVEQQQPEKIPEGTESISQKIQEIQEKIEIKPVEKIIIPKINQLEELEYAVSDPELFKKQIEKFGLSYDKYEFLFANKTMKNVIELYEKKELDERWNPFVKWIKSFNPTEQDLSLKIDEFLRLKFEEKLRDQLRDQILSQRRGSIE